MPRVKDISGPFRFFFTSFDCTEPPHIHVERDERTCKFWLEPLMKFSASKECSMEARLGGRSPARWAEEPPDRTREPAWAINRWDSLKK